MIGKLCLAGAGGLGLGILGTLAYQKYVSGEESAEELDSIAEQIQDLADKKRSNAKRAKRRPPAAKAKATPRKKTTKRKKPAKAKK